MAFKLLCVRRKRKALTNPKQQSFIFSPIISDVNESYSPFVLHMLGALNVTVRQISNLDCSTDKRKLLAVQCNLGLDFRTVVCWQWVLFVDLNLWKENAVFERRRQGCFEANRFLSEEPVVLEMARRIPKALLWKSWTYQKPDRQLRNLDTGRESKRRVSLGCLLP